MRVPDDLLDAVCFLCSTTDDTNISAWQMRGTAFFVRMPDVEMAGWSHTYVVTAKHNITNAKQRGLGVGLRLNTTDGRIGFNLTDLEGWRFPEDPGSDLAVYSWDPPAEIFESKTIPITMLVDEARRVAYGLGVGDDLVIPGLFSHRSGHMRNIPLLRSGIIAAMLGPEPLLDATTGAKYRAYVGEFRSIGGMSGSPVLAVLSPGRMAVGTEPVEPGKFRILMLGVVRGHWDYTPPFNEAGVGQEELRRANMGMALITPAHELLAFLNSPVFQEERGVQRERYLKRLVVDDPQQPA